MASGLLNASLPAHTRYGQGPPERYHEVPTALLASPGLLGSSNFCASMRPFPIIHHAPGRPLVLRTRSQHAGGGPDLAPFWVKLGPASTPN